MIVSEQEKQLCRALRDFPQRFENRYTPEARRHLLRVLFTSLVNENPEFLDVLFNHNLPAENVDWSLREAQGAIDGSEYTEAARGKPCGHIFKAGEATYRCKTCTLDDTCVLCSRCYESSDHTGHMIQISVSPGNSGCCDCGDVEAWRIPVNCAIHSPEPSSAPGKGATPVQIPAAFVDSIRLTVGRALDYVCDVVSCSPEQLRLSKSESSIREDERASRLTKSLYADGDAVEETPEFALILWNDEKHGIYEVQEQVARACRETLQFGIDKARETHDVGRSVITYSRDLKELLEKARIIEHIKITVTIRSARDTFREQMCSTIIEWLLDISGCSVGPDHDMLKQTVCKEMLKTWRPGSSAANAIVGREGIDDHEIEDGVAEREIHAGRVIQDITTRPDGNITITILQPNSDDEADDEQADEESQAPDGEPEDLMDLDVDASDADLDMRPAVEPTDELEVEEATLAGYPPPPPPPPPPPATRETDAHERGRAASNATLTGPPEQPSAGHSAVASASEERLGPALATPKAVIQVPKTPFSHARTTTTKSAPPYWLQKPSSTFSNVPLAEDIRQRVRLDWMILFDLRLWKKARVDLRDLYISTVVTVPDFKRILGLRFAGLYTVLAQLYLIADREPDHSIIYLSLQMLTTPSITQEIIEKGNFLTNLIAILYTFLTARQVGHPSDVSLNATLAFDAGSVTNRRMYHFFMDMKHLFLSQYVQERLREEPRYVLQFLDLVKLPQGICPNQRAVGEHVEYETDAWISASILTRELNRLCRQFAEAFKWRLGTDMSSTSRTIRLFAWAAIINSLGLERKRFTQSEIKHVVELIDHDEAAFELDRAKDPHAATVVKFVVEEGHISFHHALHYTLSWLIDGAKSMSAHELRSLLLFNRAQLEEEAVTSLRSSVPVIDDEGYLIVMFDYPIRVCAWLAQMKAGMWVRNGLSLRHQMSTYRGVAPRDLAYKQDIFLIQVAMVTCNPERVLLSMIDRFGMNEWMLGNFASRPGWEDTQMLDVAEDFVHLLIVLSTERTALHAIEDEPAPQSLAIRRELTHILCFKTLSFSELTSRLAEKFQEHDDFQEILDEMTNFKAPESLNDTGVFELKKEFLADLDPYAAHYTKNQRDEAETKYREWMSASTGKPLAEVVMEPKLRPIKSGVFKDLTGFMRTRLFAQVLYRMIQWGLTAQTQFQAIPATRVEAFLTVVLHLMLVAVLQETPEDAFTLPSSESFVCRLLCGNASVPEDSPSRDSIFLALNKILQRDDFATCHPRVKLILLRVRQRRNLIYAKVTSTHGIAVERLGTESPSNASGEDLEAKKRQALERKAKVMAQFQKQQQDFMSNQNSIIDWGDVDFEDSDSADMEQEEHKKLAKYPSGNCILCQEETNDTRLYGTFALLTESTILRQTPYNDSDYVNEVLELPGSLDRSAEAIRPFGVGGRNRVQVRKFTSEGFEVMGERQGLGKGFDPECCRPGPVSVGCGHIMHYSCFEVYCAASHRRQTHQIARNHPERLDRNEFVCPLCKALGNTFLPIIWKPKEESYPGALQTESSFNEWLQGHIGLVTSRFQKASVPTASTSGGYREQEVFTRNIANTLIPPSALALFDGMSTDPGPTSPLRSSMANLPGMLLEETSPTLPTVSETFALEELMTIYGRIRDTFKKNNLPSQFQYDPRSSSFESLAHTDVLASALGWSISATEIAQRGVESEPGMLLLDRIPYLTLTHLRILADTASSYIAIGGLRGGGNNRPTAEFHQIHTKQLLQLLGGHPQIFEDLGSTYPFLNTPTDGSAALSLDPFILLTEASVFLVSVLQIDILHMVQLCYILEIVKVVMNAQNYFQTFDGSFMNTPGRQTVSAETIESFGIFIKAFEAECNLPSSLYSDPVRMGQVCNMVASYALAYLRKVVILLHVSYGVDFPNTGYADMDESELDRITRALRLPTLAETFTLAKAQSEDGQRTAMGWVMVSWVAHFEHMCKQRGSKKMADMAIQGFRPSHPGIFELIGLPKYYDTLLDEVMRRRCPTTKKDLTDPTICLFCGAIFCSQAVCCSRDGLGGCNQHVKQCGRNIGIFINLRKCCVLYLHNGNGSWTNAPYLDKHGEVDPGLRRTRQLMLSEKRYDGSLRSVWLNHLIPTTISRKLEADINNGGWETL